MDDAEGNSQEDVRAAGLIVEVRDHVGYATIDRPERANSLSADLQAAITETFDRFHRDPGIWAAVLAATGDRMFCAGNDLKDADLQDGPLPFEPMRGLHRNVMEAVLECGIPTVAAINGWAAGGGLELALACDLRVVASHARMSMPESKRGMGGNFGAQLLIRTLPSAIAYEMLYLAEPIDADTALRWGLVNRVVEQHELMSVTESMVRSIVAMAPLSQQRYKSATQRGRDLPLAAALRLDVRPNPYVSDDRREGLAAFLEGREPVWTGH